MADYWLTQDILGAIGWGFIAFLVVAFGMAILIPKDRNLKIILCGVIGLFAFAVGGQVVTDYRAARIAAEKYQQKLAKATALFEERCKSSGEKIHKTVSGVRGVFLINRRPQMSYDQFDMNDPGGDSARGEAYVKIFLHGRDPSPTAAYPLTQANRDGAFEFVEAATEGGTEVVRYRDIRPTIDGKPVTGKLLGEELVQRRSARYGIEWTDISTREDRLHWIAGSRIRVVDMETLEVLGERIGYVMDRGQGVRGGGRDPWLTARNTACPPFKTFGEAFGLTRMFSEKVLKRDGS